MLSQEAIAIAFEAELRRLSTPECYFNSISVELTAKRDYMVRFLKEAGMNPIVPEGGYFLLADWSSLGKLYKPFAYHIPNYAVSRLTHHTYQLSIYDVPQLTRWIWILKMMPIRIIG